jgi:hypothetical protein
LIPNRPLEADLVAAHRVDGLLEAGQVDEGEMIHLLTDDRLHGSGQSGRPVHRGASLQSVVELVLAPTAHVFDEEVTWK